MKPRPSWCPCARGRLAGLPEASPVPRPVQPPRAAITLQRPCPLQALCVLELRYIVRCAPLGKATAEGRRPPWLHDPNTGFETGDCTAAVEYLYREYATGETAGTISWRVLRRRQLQAERSVIRGLFVSVGPVSV